MQNPAVLLSWESFQNPFFPDLEIQYLLGNTKSILMYFSTNKGEWDREEKKKASGKHTNEIVLKQTTHLGNMLNTFFSLSARSLQENVLNWCSKLGIHR